VTQSETNGSAGPAQAQFSQASQPAQAGPLDSSKLLRGAKSVEISHNGAVYRLQATRLGKLILTK